MRFILANDFDAVKTAYLDVIGNTPQIYQHARWEYGKHPRDELIREYMARDEMYVLMDGDEVAGMVAICPYQGEDYEPLAWQINLENDQVATLHLLAVRPAYRGRSLGTLMLQEATRIAAERGKRALRLDTLRSNAPSQRIYANAGFSYVGEQRLYAENTGVLDFLYYEKLLGQTT